MERSNDGARIETLTPNGAFSNAKGNHMFDKANVSESSSQATQQFLTFSLCDQEFGIEILRVQEIKNYSRVTPIPNSPPNVKGVMNLRGTVIPIVDLRNTLGMSSAEYDKFTVIIVVNIDSRIVGLVVDAVSDVMDVNQTDIEVPPSLSSDANVSVVNGIAKAGDRLITILNISKLINVEPAAAVA